MNAKTLIRSVLSLVAFYYSGASTMAQDKHDVIDSWHVDAVAEGQLGLSNGKANIATMLDYGADVNLWRGGQLNVNAITTWMQHDEDHVSTDPLVFSNLDAPSRFFRFYTLGLSQQLGPVNVFAGVGSTVTDYFADDEVCYFVGSAHGIHPVLTGNYDIATYPVSALSVRLRWDINKQWRLLTTFYNGATGDHISDEFHLGDGVTNITAVNYHGKHRTFELGACTGRDNRQRHGTSLYGYDIEHVNSKLSVIAEAGCYLGAHGNTSADDGADLCRCFGALGCLCQFDEANQLGVIGTASGFTNHCSDCDLEVNYTRQFGPLAVQPVVVVCRDNNHVDTYGMLRLSLSFGK